MKTLTCCEPRQAVLDGSEDSVVNLSALLELSEAEAAEFLDSNVLTSGMEELIMQAFDRLSGGPSRGLFKLSESTRTAPRLLEIMEAATAQKKDLFASAANQLRGGTAQTTGEGSQPPPQSQPQTRGEAPPTTVPDSQPSTLNRRLRRPGSQTSSDAKSRSCDTVKM